MFQSPLTTKPLVPFHVSASLPSHPLYATANFALLKISAKLWSCSSCLPPLALQTPHSCRVKTVLGRYLTPQRAYPTIQARVLDRGPST